MDEDVPASRLQRLNLRKPSMFTPGRRSLEIVFWMCLVALIMLVIYVRLTKAMNLDWIFIAYSVAVASVIVGRYVFFKLHRPELLPTGEYLPTMHVIVPCRNESRQVYRTARSIHRATYPRNKLKVTLINDGSNDDTAVWLKRVVEDFGWKVIDLPKNKGKRRAIKMALDSRRAEISVFMDSDVNLHRRALIEIVRGFNHEKVAAVCGHTGVANHDTNLITKMQEQYYYLSYSLFRSAEAYFKTVNCCPGSFSAYRTSSLETVLEDWVGQSFLGVSRTYGDDRSLTHLLLRDKWDTVYNPRAKATTIVPERFSDFLRQQGRWRRGFLMEACNGVTHMWRRPLGASFLFYLSLLLVLMGPLVVFYYLLFVPLYSGVMPMGYVTAILMITLLHQIFFAMFREADALKVGLATLMPAVPVWVFTALLIIPLALLTLKDNRWLTRSAV